VVRLDSRLGTSFLSRASWCPKAGIADILLFLLINDPEDLGHWDTLGHLGHLFLPPLPKKRRSMTRALASVTEAAIPDARKSPRTRLRL
jgi:hypothetical protein